jgi:acetoin utilization protein AcuB
MRLSQIMSTRVLTIAPGRAVSEALEEMRQHDLHHLVVVEDGKAVGIMSARDRGDGQLGREVRDVMHAPVISATTRTTVREAANLLRGRSIGCLPVYDGDRLAGMVTTTDLLELIGRGIQRPVAESTAWTVGRRPDRATKRR